MSGVEAAEDGEISLFAIGATLLRNRWRIFRWALIGGVVAALSVITRPALYSASLGFVPQGSDVARSGLASLAGQFGITAGVSNPSQSPEFYVGLVKSRELLDRIVRDTLTVAEMGGMRVAYTDLFKVAPGRQQQELAIKGLAEMVKASIARNTGVVQVSIATRWPSVSLAIASALLDGVNDYNVRTRQTQAAAERKFIESRLAVARAELRAAEDQTQAFLSKNRDISNSPQLAFERDRLQRDVSLQQQVFTTLTQSFEDVRVREVRDTPTISVFESPVVSSLPEPRGRVKRTLLGIILGGFAGALLALVSQVMRRRKEFGDPEADEFLAALREVKRDVPRFGRKRDEIAR